MCKRSRKFRLYFMPFFQALSPVLQKSHFVAATMLMLFSPSFWMDFNRLLSIRFSSFGKREGGVHSYPNSWWTFQNLAWPFFSNFVSIQKWCSFKSCSNNISLFLLSVYLSTLKRSSRALAFISFQLENSLGSNTTWDGHDGWGLDKSQEGRRRREKVVVI